MPTPSDPTKLFADHPALYARYRPQYPRELYEFLVDLCPAPPKLAWDVATGSGQVAVDLAKFFEDVVATDVSEEQLEHAFEDPRVRYLQAPAEESPLLDASAQLITVGSGLHWFDLDAFYAEADRVLIPGGVLAAWAYGGNHFEPEIPGLRDLIRPFALETLADYWSPGNEMTATQYESVELPFESIDFPELEAVKVVTVDHYIGYLHTWSAVQRYHREEGEDPVDLIEDELRALWPNGATRRLVWPLFGRVARKS